MPQEIYSFTFKEITGLNSWAQMGIHERPGGYQYDFSDVMRAYFGVWWDEINPPYWFHEWDGK